MKHTLTKFTVVNMLEITGHDISFINLFYRIDSGREIPTPFVIHYESLLNFIQEQNVDAYRYLKQIRSNINGYGPKHSKIFMVINEEGFDLEPYIVDLFNALDPELFEKHIEVIEQNTTIEEVDQLIVKFSELDEMMDDEHREYNIKMNEFTDVIGQAIHELTFKYYPELFEKDNPYIEAYREGLTNTTLDFVDKIDNLLNDEL